MGKLIFLYLIGGLFWGAWGLDLHGFTIGITDDGSEWPPYTYYQRVDGKPSTEIVGFSVDVITEILGREGIDFKIQLLPWKRAQAEVEDGSEFQMFLSGSWSEERALKYYISHPYYSTSGYYFYSKTKFPEGLSVNNLDDIKKYSIAGLAGHSYADYGIASSEIYQGTNSYSALIGQILLGRYDIFLESLEIIAGYSTITENVLDNPDLAYVKVPGMKTVEFYMMFTKNEVGLELKKVVDKGLSEMNEAGRLTELLKKYIPE